MTKEELKAQRKAYRERHKEAIKACNKVYRKANREKDKARKQAYYQAHKKEIKAYGKVYYQANKEAIKARCKAHRKANCEYHKARGKAWQKAHPEKCREAARKHSALKCQTQVELISENRLFMRDGWICQICKTRVNKRLKHPDPMSSSLDHITPLSKGGTHTYDNVQLVHLKCNLSKHNRVLPQGEQMRMF